MKQSPVQLLEATILQVSVTPILDDAELGEPKDGDEFFDTSQGMHAAADYWDDEAPEVKGVDKRTFRLHLGLRSSPHTFLVHDRDYSFEIVCGAVVAVIPEKFGKKTPEVWAWQVGMTAMYGMIREVLMQL